MFSEMPEVEYEYEHGFAEHERGVSRRPACSFGIAGALALSLLLAGCTSMDTVPEKDTAKAGDDTAKMDTALRKPGPPGRLLGIDEQAREVERHLGYR